jgi:hypothetical protein
MKPVIARSLDTASLAAIALLLVSGAVAVACCRSLYADGAYHLLVIITTDGVMHDWPSRLFANYLTGFPVVLALDWGVRSLRALTMIYSASLLYIPLLAYSAAIWIARADRLLWTATIVVVLLCYFPASFFMVGQFHLLYALSWLGFVILLTGNADRLTGVLGLAFIGFLLIRSYDLSVALCPALAGLCGWRIAVAPDWRVKLLLTVAIGLLLFAAWTGLEGVRNPSDPTSKADFLIHTQDFLENPQLHGGMILAALAVAAAFEPRRWLTIALGGILAVRLAGKAISAFQQPEWMIYGFHPYDQRGKAFLLLVAIGVVVLTLRCVGWPRPGVRFAAWPPILLLLWVAGATVLDTADWARYLEALCTELRTEGDFGTAEFLAQPLARKFLWDWTGPTMSVLLRPEGSSKIIVFHPPDEPSFEPFDPASGGPDIAIFKSAGPICHDPGAR